VRGFQDIPQHIDRGGGLDRNTSQHPVVVNVSDQLFGASIKLRHALGALGGRRGCGLVVEAVQIAAGVLELLDPLLGLVRGKAKSAGDHWRRCWSGRYLSDHHVAVERPLAVALGRPVDVGSDLGDDRGAKREVGHKVPIPVPAVSMRLPRKMAK